MINMTYCMVPPRGESSPRRRTPSPGSTGCVGISSGSPSGSRREVSPPPAGVGDVRSPVECPGLADEALPARAVGQLDRADGQRGGDVEEERAEVGRGDRP